MNGASNRSAISYANAQMNCTNKLKYSMCTVQCCVNTIIIIIISVIDLSLSFFVWLWFLYSCSARCNSVPHSTSRSYIINLRIGGTLLLLHATQSGTQQTRAHCDTGTLTQCHHILREGTELVVKTCRLVQTSGPSARTKNTPAIKT